MSSSASSSTPSSLTGGGKLTPNLDQRSTKLLNLTVLQRVDPFIEEILITAAHVTLYEFNIDLNQWSRKDVEGSLFVVKRNAQPRFQFVVMNRRNTENLVEDLIGDFEYEVQVPYLLYRNSTQEVNGIWFYNSRECDEVANLFSRLLSAYSKVAPKSTPSKSEFEELEAMPISAVIEGPLEPSVTPAASTVRPDDSFMNFFNMPRSTGHSSSNNVNSGQFYHNIAPTAPSSHVYNATPSHTPSQQVPSFPVTSPSVPSSTLTAGSNQNNSNRISDLVKPSSFYAPPSSSSSSLLTPPPVTSSGGSTSALRTLMNLPSSHGTPMLQPFPPPTPPLSLTANPGPNADFGALRKEKVRDAFLMLVQDNQFIEMVHNALMKVHHQS